MKQKLMAASLAALMMTGACASSDPNEKTKEGALAGAAAGAVAGAVIGHQSGNRDKGAAIGAVAGAAVGAAVGRRMDQQQRELEQIEGVEVERTAEDELNVVLKNDVLFDINSAGLRSESRATLRDMAGVFSRYQDTTILVEGHADASGATAHNQELSERRADSVRGYLIDQGVTSSRIVARGYGEAQPKASNSTPEGRQLNRRVELHIKAAPAS